MMIFDAVNLFPSVLKGFKCSIKITVYIVKEHLDRDSMLCNWIKLLVYVIMKLLGLCLDCVCFWFEGNYYSQKNAMPIGSSLSPTLANVSMNSFEEKIFGMSIKKCKLWLRYIDDMFVIWLNDNEELDKLFEFINTELPLLVKFGG